MEKENEVFLVQLYGQHFNNAGYKVEEFISIGKLHCDLFNPNPTLERRQCKALWVNYSAIANR